MPLREALLFLVVCVLCLGALVRPKVGLYGYVWFAVLRPDVLAWCENDHPFSLALAVCTAIGSFRYYGRAKVIFSNPTTLALLGLQVPIGLSVLAAVDIKLATPNYWAYLKMLLVLLLIPMLIETERDLRNLLLVIAGSAGFLGAKFGISGILHGGVVWDQGYGAGLLDNNQLGLAFVMAIPLCWYCRTLVDSRWAKWVLLITGLASVAAVIMTNSRGASISLGVAFLLMAWRSDRKALTFCMLVLAAGGAVYMMRDTYVKRMMTLKDVKADQSADSRIEQAAAAFAMWKDHPLLGVGFGRKNYSRLVGRYLGNSDNHVAHNSYLQMLADSGVFAFLLYTGMLFGTIRWLGASYRRIKWHGPELSAFPAGIQCSLSAFAVGSTFYSFGEYDLPYILLMCAAAWWTLERSMDAEETHRDLDGADAGPAAGSSAVQVVQQRS
jgi:putative inorganic carbon (hco3(-)) transporter